MRGVNCSMMRHALLIEPHTLFAPFLTGMLERAGSRVTVTPRAGDRVLRTLDPALAVVDTTASDAEPLRQIRDIRAALPNARIVVYARAFEATWALLAAALGADAIVGPSATEHDLDTALRAWPQLITRD